MRNSRVVLRKLGNKRTRSVVYRDVGFSSNSVRYQSNTTKSAPISDGSNTDDVKHEELDEPSLRKLLSHSRSSNYTKVAKVLEAISRKNLRLEPQEILSLIQSPVSNQIQPHLKKAFHAIKRNSQPLTAPVTSALITYFRKHNMITEALNVHSYSNIKKVPKDADTWAAICRVYGTMNRKDLLRPIVGKFTNEANNNAEHQKVLSDPTFQESSILACGDCNDPTSLTKILEARHAKGIPHDVNVFTSLFKVGLKSNNYESAFAVFPEMKKANIKPTITFMNETMEEFRKAGKFGQMEAMFERMNIGDPFYPKHNAQSIVILLQATIDRYNLYVNDKVGSEDIINFYSDRVEHYLQLIKADKEVYSQPLIQDLYAEYLSHIHGTNSEGFFKALESHIDNIKSSGAYPSAKIITMLLKYYVNAKNDEEAFKIFDFLRNHGLHSHESYKLAEQANTDALDAELTRIVGPRHTAFEAPEVHIQKSRVMRRKGKRIRFPTGFNPKMILNPKYGANHKK
eukprot:TRINITY_DN22317_c0_g1_i1.p1 TRINITY_DN22317_c0_g1~~TRINITY_DN22317_c0_g1_i1.p1  ORF type:complete len:513 (-),score=64.68 TRINITY_DN22317_c0_g1_i1:8-1546(-)